MTWAASEALRASSGVSCAAAEPSQRATVCSASAASDRAGIRGHFVWMS